MSLIEIPQSTNIWDKHDDGNYIVVPTNGTVRKDGHLVMGRGLAQQAAKRYPDLPGHLGEYIKKHGNRVYFLESEEYRIFSFPVKDHWRDRASLELIQKSALDLTALVTDLNARTKFQIGSVYLPRVGCGNGRLTWDEVKPTLLFALGKSETKFYVTYEPGHGR